MVLYEEARDRFRQRGDDNFCVPMAIGMITDRDPLDVNDDMMDDGIRKFGDGVRKTTYSRWMRDHYRIRLTDVTYKYLKGKGMSVGKLQKKLDPNRNFLIGIDGHLLASRRGVIEDWTSGRRHHVEYVEELKEDGIEVSDYKPPSDYTLRKWARNKSIILRSQITQQPGLFL
jgi:hypothetical protein